MVGYAIQTKKMSLSPILQVRMRRPCMKKLRSEIRRCKKKRNEFVGCVCRSFHNDIILCYLTEIKGCPS